MKAMFFLPEQIDLGPFSYVVLSSHGRYLAPQDGSNLSLVSDGRPQPIPHTGLSLRDRYRRLLETFLSDEPDCLGLGKKPDFPPVLLHVTIRDGYGQARAIFHHKPCEDHYELLKAVGVEYQGGYSAEAGFLALFRNRLPAHIHAGALAGYTRTGNCNQFFLNHGEIDRSLEAGLIQASESRTAWGRETGLPAARKLADRACEACLAMTCQPPSFQSRFQYGDLVPLGFLLKALNQGPGDQQPGARVREKLLAGRQGALWPFHTGRLVTSTDSVLILQALPEREGVEALEGFSDGHGRYYPQLWSQTKQPGRMLISESNAHWCQPDFATSCLVRSLRAETGLSQVTPLQYLESYFENRSGLYFANPYLTDWAFACAIRADAHATELQARLRQEIFAGMNDDDSFGTYDIALSTSFAILSLAALGCRGRLLRLAQLRLLDLMDASSGLWPECIPFYSTFRASAADEPRTCPQILDIDGSLYELSLYIDTHRIIATAVAVLALGEHCDPEVRDLELRNVATIHPRYRCRNHAEYVAEFALPPYLQAQETRSCVA